GERRWQVFPFFVVHFVFHFVGSGLGSYLPLNIHVHAVGNRGSQAVLPLPGGEGRYARPLSLGDSAAEADVSLSSFGGEGRGEEAHTDPKADVPRDQHPTAPLRVGRRVAAIAASSPYPSPPMEERAGSGTRLGGDASPHPSPPKEERGCLRTPAG